MNISLIGYGKMGKEIEKLCISKGHNIYSIADPMLGTDLSVIKGADLAIEFTQPGSVINNIKYCLENDIPLVCGTTGWHDQLEEIKNLCISKNGSMFFSSNYSIGVNLFWQASKYMAKLMDSYAGYALSLHEIHHDQKKDAPSGTAVTLAMEMLAASDRFKSWTYVESPTHHTNDIIPISSERTGTVPGTHVVEYKSPNDRIVLIHEAFSRGGFVEGVVTAAEWLNGKKGFFGMDDLFDNK